MKWDILVTGNNSDIELEYPRSGKESVHIAKEHDESFRKYLDYFSQFGCI